MPGSAEAVVPATPAVGTPAPDFTLPSTAGGTVTLSHFRARNVLVAFFPLAFTRTCTAETRSFTEEFDRFRDAETEVLPISVDSIPTLKEFKAKECLSVDLLSDFKRQVARSDGALPEEYSYAKCAYSPLDRRGVVHRAHAEASPGVRRENSEILERIGALA